MSYNTEFKKSVLNNFDFSIGNNEAPIITLLSSGIAFNQFSIAALGEPEYISIGLDRENRVLAITASNNTDDKAFCRYSFVNSEKKKKYLIITATKLRAEINRLLELKPVRNGIKFIAEFNSDSKMLIIDFNLR